MPFALNPTSFLRTGISLVALCTLSAPALAGEVRFSGDGHAENPAWSADGKYLAFEVNKFAGDIDMYFAQITGDIAKDAQKVKLPGAGSGFGASGQVVINAAWHPEGIAVFEGSNQGGQLRLYFAAPGGAAASPMLDQTKAPGGLSQPAISGDGNQLAFISDNTGNGDLSAWDRSTDKLTQLTTTEETESFPDFNKDASKLVFTRKQDDSLTIYEYDLSTGSETPLVSGGTDQTRPIYAAGGRIVFFAGAGENKWNLVVVEADGSGRRTIAEGVRFPTRSRPALSPDGEWVAFAYDDPTKANKIVLARIDGTATAEVKSSYVACGEPSMGLQNGQVILSYTALPSASSDWRALHIVDVTDKL